MSEFLEHLHEVFAGLGPIQIRRMFGGHGVFHQGLMVGLIADETLYLKTDAQTAARFEQAAQSPFNYNKAGKSVQMSYYTAPEEALEDPQIAQDWTRLAWEAALRARSGKRVKGSRARKE